MVCLRPHTLPLLLLPGLLLAAVVGSAADQELLYTMGTSIATGEATAATYLVFESEDTELLRGRQFAVYRKEGMADAVQDYQRVSVVGLQLNPRTIRVLLARSQALGDDLADLDMRLRGMYGSLAQAADLRREERLRLVLQAAKGDPDMYENAYLLGRMHPGVSLALGTAFSETVAPGTYTYEIRTLAGTEVLGRVTVDTKDPTILPAPGPAQAVVPVERAAAGTAEGALVPSAKGHLNVSLRWAVPDDLRRVGLLRTGFNVYRVDPDVATAEDWVVAPPAAGVLAVAAANGKGVKRVNALPILVGSPLDVVEAADPTDRSTIYLIDNNGRFRDDGVPFKNGDQFYYYVAARDLLARDGEYSLGTLVTICDRLPPSAPSAVRVDNSFAFVKGAEKHVLKVRWRAPKPREDEVLTRYYVYRWDSVEQMQMAQGNPAVNRVGVVEATGETGEFVDDGSVEFVAGDDGGNLIHVRAEPGVPSGTDDLAKTFWYSVRAVDDSACGGNASGNSAPGFGVLRARSFDGRATGKVSIVSDVVDVQAVAGSPTTVPLEATDTAITYYFRYENTLSSPQIAWTEFYVGNMDDGPQLLLKRTVTSEGNLTQTLDGSFPKSELSGQVAFFCRVGLTTGETAEKMLAGIIPKSVRAVYTFSSTYRQNRVDCNPDHPRHVSVAPDDTWNPVVVTLTLPEGTAEYKLYRRIDDGPLTMLAQGLAADDLTKVVEEDTRLVLHDAVVSYYAQVFDVHGNPGPLVLLRALEMTGRAALTPPRLLPLVPAGTPENPRLRLRWFAPAPGIEQYLLFLSIVDQGIGYNGPTNLSPHLTFYSQDDFLREALYLTGRVGVDFVQAAGSEDIVVRDNSYFELEVPVVAGRKYVFSMESCSLFGRTCSTRSNRVEYTWQQTGGAGTGGVAGGDDGSGTVNDPSLLPWPVRSLPKELPMDLVPERLGVVFEDQVYAVGVHLRIGEGPTRRKAADPVFFSGNVNPETLLYTAGADNPLLPFVLYRRQVASAAYPRPRDTVTQVSPMIERIPHEYDAAHDSTYVRDRFFSMFYEGRYGDTDVKQGLYLRDTQPMVRGARYEYVLVHFDPVGGEPVFSIALPAVDIPEENP